MTQPPHAAAAPGFRRAAGRDALLLAIPVRNEAAHLPGCLAALAAQPEAPALTVLLLLNGCRDGTAALARRLAPGLPFRLLLREARLPNGTAHAGEARGRAMDAGAALLQLSGASEGLLLTTDADSRVQPGWLAAILAARAAGADAVAGLVRYDPAELDTLPEPLRQRIALEEDYAALLAELEARLDPLPWDPWPRHRVQSGASLAMTLPAYRRAGGLPRLPLGEDRAMAAALEASGARLRHDPAALVHTSCRLEGRAAGGAAATLRQWIGRPDLACDPRLEAVASASRRWRLRALLRAAHQAGDAAALAAWEARLGLPPGTLAQPHFARGWQRAEAVCPALRRCPLPVAALAEQVVLARRQLSLGGAADPAGIAAPDPAAAPRVPALSR